MDKECLRCVMDTSDPEITFNTQGICNHCDEASEVIRNNWIKGEAGQKLLTEQVQKIRKNASNSEYDCILGVSGGVDSSYVLHIAAKVMNLKPLVVHVDAGWNSEIAVANVERMVKKLNLDLFTYVVNWESIKDLQIAYLKSSIANQDVPQDHAYFAKLYNLAVKKKIKYVVTGSNYSSESILPQSWGYNAMDSIQIRDIHRRFGKKKLVDYPLISYWKYKFYFPYVKRMKVVTPLNFIDYDKIKAKEFLMQEYDWKDYGGKHHESRWTKFFQSYYLPHKFGYDKRRAHLSSQIIAGQISRDEAKQLLLLPAYNETEIQSDIKYISKKLGVSEDEFRSYLKLPNKTYADYKNQVALDNVIRRVKVFLKKYFFR